MPGLWQSASTQNFRERCDRVDQAQLEQHDYLPDVDTLQSNAYLLGVCNFWCDKAYPAYEILRGTATTKSFLKQKSGACDVYGMDRRCFSGCTSAQSRYMFALCCMKLGRYLEAEKALESEDCPVCLATFANF